MIIDFRVRPPLPGFTDMSIHNPNAKKWLPWHFDKVALPSQIEKSMPLFIQEMDEAGVGKGVILPRSKSTSWGGVTNEESAAGQILYPDKFISFGGVDISMGIHEAVIEAERAVKELGCRGIVIEPGASSHPLHPDAAPYYPIYDACAAMGVPVVISQSMLLGPDLSYADPVAVQRIARDFPTVDFIIAHASYPWVTAAAAVTCVMKNVWLIPDIYMHTPAVANHDVYREAIYFTHGERILFGSAYPVRGMKQSVEDLLRCGLPQKYYEMVTYSNAAKLLGL